MLLSADLDAYLGKEAGVLLWHEIYIFHSKEDLVRVRINSRQWRKQKPIQVHTAKGQAHVKASSLQTALEKFLVSFVDDIYTQ